MNKPYPKVEFLNEHNYKDLYINTYLPFSVALSIGNINKKQVKDNETLYLDTKYFGYEYECDINISSIFLNNFSTYILYNSSIWSREYGLAFGFHIKKESFSIVHLLYRNHLIEHIQYSFTLM